MHIIICAPTASHVTVALLAGMCDCSPMPELLRIFSINRRVSAVYVPCRSACFKNVAWLHLQLHMHQGQLLQGVLYHNAIG